MATVGIKWLSTKTEIWCDGDVVGQVGPPYGTGMYGQPLQSQSQRSSVADMFVNGDFTTAAQRLQPGKMFDFDMRSYLGGVRQPLPGINIDDNNDISSPNNVYYCLLLITVVIGRGL